ncbi:MAG: hypothetical protein JWR80_2495 [Bradyrhizobium sp.]|nr:hypothetical protein [Bradyrhizobium sp.]
MICRGDTPWSRIALIRIRPAWVAAASRQLEWNELSESKAGGQPTKEHHHA